MQQVHHLHHQHHHHHLLQIHLHQAAMTPAEELTSIGDTVFFDYDSAQHFQMMQKQHLQHRLPSLPQTHQSQS